MAHQIRKDAPAQRTGGAPPRQPDYPDDISDRQIEAIKELIESKQDKTKKRDLLYSPAW